MVRRWVGVVTSLLFLHVNLKALDRACATHGASGRAGEQTADATTAHMHHAAAGHTHAPTEPTAHDAHSCELPVRADCCQFAASCGISFSVEEDTPPSSLALHVALPTHLMFAPLSPVRTPDPPPPRA